MIRPSIDSRLLRHAILGAIEHVTIRGSILGRRPKLTNVAPLIHDFFVSGIQTQAGIVTIPLQEFLQLKKSSTVRKDSKPAIN